MERINPRCCGLDVHKDSVWACARIDGQSFIENWRRLKTGATKWQNEAVYQLTRDIREVFRFQDLDINAADDAQIGDQALRQLAATIVGRVGEKASLVGHLSRPGTHMD